MNTRALEPGLLQAFRWYAGVRLALALLQLALRLAGIELTQFRLIYPGLLEALFLLGYLSWPGLARRLGRSYLPLALAAASAAPILNHMANLRARLALGLPPSAAAADGEDHYGLHGMRERAELLDGELTVASRPGQGTTVRLTVEAAL